MLKAFVDTDVVLDFLMDRKPFVDEASPLFALAENGQIDLFTSPLVIANSYYILRKLGSHTRVIQQLKLLTQILGISAMQKSTVIDALNSEFKDFEDALQNFTATNNRLSIIITRNHKDFNKSEATIVSPTDFLKLISIT